MVSPEITLAASHFHNNFGLKKIPRNIAFLIYLRETRITIAMVVYDFVFTLSLIAIFLDLNLKMNLNLVLGFGAS